MLPALVAMAVSSFLVGPSALLHLPNSPLLIAFGLVVSGTCRGISMALCVPDAITGGISKFPDEAAKVTDLTSSLFFFSLGLALLVGPIIGSALVKGVGF